MKKNNQRALWWVKRDMRVHDNLALTAALSEAKSVSAFFVIEPGLLTAQETSYMHVYGWWQALRELQNKLRALGSELYFPHGEVVEVLQQLQDNHPFDALFSHEETGTSITYQRDIAVAAWCKRHKVDWQELPQNGVIRGLRDRSLRQPIIKKRLRETSPVDSPERISKWDIDCWPANLPEISSLGVIPSPQLDTDQLQVVSETAANDDLSSFLEQRAFDYSGGISSPNTAFVAGSRLSTHLAWGTISLRTVFARSDASLQSLDGQQDPESKQWRKSLLAFQSRLHWHDHFIQRLETEPEMEFHSLNRSHDGIVYEDNPAILQAWSAGQTGMPMIDACMRCLNTTGFINFRMRAMLVTTACFGLKLSWRSIMHPLSRVFFDYEPGIHIAQIQMQASLMGINTMRVYSPAKQLADQDADAEFVKHWIPELRRFKATSILDYENRTLGKYPPVIDDIKANTAEMKAQIYAIRRTDEAKQDKADVLEKHGSRKPLKGAKKSAAKKAKAKKRVLKKTASGKNTDKVTVRKKTAAKKITAKKDSSKTGSAKNASRNEEDE